MTRRAGERSRSAPSSGTTTPSWRCCSRPSTPRIGGVLLRGDKGSAKTTLARGLAALLPGDAPFVELPLGATEDRLIGTLDLGAAAHRRRAARFGPGLLAAAHGGVLYVDEVNLLADHLVDALLDVAASRRQPRRARRDLARAPGPLRAHRLDEPRGGRAAATAARPVRSRR